MENTYLIRHKQEKWLIRVYHYMTSKVTINIMQYNYQDAAVRKADCIDRSNSLFTTKKRAGKKLSFQPLVLFPRLSDRLPLLRSDQTTLATSRCWLAYAQLEAFRNLLHQGELRLSRHETSHHRCGYHHIPTDQDQGCWGCWLCCHTTA